MRKTKTCRGPTYAVPFNGDDDVEGKHATFACRHTFILVGLCKYLNPFILELNSLIKSETVLDFARNTELQFKRDPTTYLNIYSKHNIASEWL